MSLTNKDVDLPNFFDKIIGKKVYKIVEKFVKIPGKNSFF
jgi:hypothetical protein